MTSAATQPPLRILQVLRAPVGGLFRHVRDLTISLAERGHAVGIVVDSEASDTLTAGKLAALEPHAMLGIHRYRMPRLLGPGDITTPYAIGQLARKLRIDVLHGHGAKGGFSARLARFGNPSAVALYTPHGGVLHYAPTTPAGRIFRFLERALLRQTDAMIFESAFAQQAFYRQIVKPTCPAPVIHNGLAAHEFEPVTPVHDARDFVFIGELREIKGIAFLLDALVAVTAADGRPATLALAGDGPDRASIEAQVARLGLGDRVTLLGAQPARPTFALGRCVMVPSLAESLPYIILEAAAAARPVIATRVGGIAEIFGPTAGDLVPAGDANALRVAMQQFLDDPAEADDRMRERLAFISTRFSLTHMTDQIEALYRRLLADR